MKRAYNAPKLTVHGNVEAITEAVGSTPTPDAILVNGVPLSVPTDGSGDVVV